MEFLSLLDHLFRIYRDEGHPPSLKEMATLRAMAVFDVSPHLPPVTPLPVLIAEAVDERE